VLKVSISSPIREQVHISITDIGGRNLYGQSFLLQQGEQVLQLPAVNALSAGIYQLTVRSTQQQTTTRIIKAK
jgi:hypothetical protein